MLISYIRSSGVQQYSFCQQQYYINYVLGVSRESSLKALKGTAVHKALEILAGIKYRLDSKLLSSLLANNSYNDKELGQINFNPEDFLKAHILSNEEVDAINKTRINKSTYKDECKLKYGHIRYGIPLVEELIEKSCKCYAKNWAPIDYRDVNNWTWMLLDFKQGLFDPRRKKIVVAEPHFDFTIDKDWAKYEWVLPNKKKISGKLKIRGTIDLITDVGDGIIEVTDYKGLPIDTKIPTIDGWKTMESLKNGDIIFDENGKQTKIIKKSRKKVKPCYKIYFDDKSTVICDEEHLWKLKNGNIVNTLNLCIRNEINTTKPLDIENKILPIDPYVFGAWLGDGRNRTGEICGMDRFIFDEIERRGYKLGKNMEKRQKKTCSNHTILGLRTQLRLLNLLHNKHIPTIYLRASYSQRLDLLRGLLDTDGNVNLVRKQAIFTNCNKRLSDDVKELLLSLGQRPYQANVDGYGFGIHVKVYPISFKPIDINPFLLPRKSNKIKKEWGYGYSNRRKIKKIEYIGKQETQCIMVDSPTKTYLCTENMIPTHNTGQRIDWTSPIDNKIKTYKDFCQDFQLMLYYYAVRRMYPLVKQIIVTIFYIRDGGPFTVCFDDKTLEEVENKLCEHFETIKLCNTPTMQDPTQTNFKCKYICDYFKMPSPDGKTNFCKFIHDEIKQVGIDKVTNKYMTKGFDIGNYEAPGEI